MSAIKHSLGLVLTRSHWFSPRLYNSRKCSLPALQAVKVAIFVLILNPVHGFLPQNGGDSLLPSLSSFAKSFSESDLGKTLTDAASKIGADKLFKLDGDGGKSPLSFLQSVLDPNSTIKNIVFIPAGVSVPLFGLPQKEEEAPEFGSDADSKEEKENDNSLLKVLAEINRKIFGGKQPDYKLADSAETNDEANKGDGTTYYD